MAMNVEFEINSFFDSICSLDEYTREYEVKITKFVNSHCTESDIAAFRRMMNLPSEYSYIAFFCLATIYRHNKDYSKLYEIIQIGKKREDFCNRESFKHIIIMYETHSESLYDYDELLKSAHESACMLTGNSGYQHTFANVFATICENCLSEDLESIVSEWYDAALFCVNRAIQLEPDYAKYYSTKARIVILKNKFEEANRLIMKAIDSEDSRNKEHYSIRISDYQFYRAMFAIKKQQWLTKSTQVIREENEGRVDLGIAKKFQKMRPYVFVSYSHADSEKMCWIVGKLKKHNVNIWLDEGIVGGGEWDEIIGNRLIGCEVVLLLLSATAIASKNVRNEINMAQNHKKPIIPVFLEDCDLTPGAELQLQGYNAYHAFRISNHYLIEKLLSDVVYFTEAPESEHGTGPVLKQSDLLKKESLQKTQEGSVYDSIETGTLPDICIIEQLCEGKTSDQKQCEDMLVVTDDYLAVFDGATSKNNCKYHGKTGGRLTVEFLAEYIQGKEMSRNIDGKTAICQMQAALRNYNEKMKFEEMGIHLCASAVIFSVSRKQIWSVGDCQFMVNNKLYTFTKKVDEIMSQTRALTIQTLLHSGMKEEELLEYDKARELILGELSYQKYLENTDGEYGYSVLSSKGSIQDMFLLDIAPGSEVVLASDGYPNLYGTLEESESSLKQLIKADPLCYKIIKSTKGLTKGNQYFDDRTYIRFRVN